MNFRKIIDLTYPLNSNSPRAPGLPKPEIELSFRLLKNGFNMERVNFLTHIGTHIDAPFHFINNGKKLHEIKVSRLHGKGVIVDLRHKKSDEEITIRDFNEYDNKIDHTCIVILITGWGRKRGFSKEYIYHHPYLGIEGTRYLVSKRIKGVGIDHLSISGVKLGKATKIHRELLGNDIWIAEDIYIPKGIFGNDWYIIALPMLIRDTSGGPLRIIAVR